MADPSSSAAAAPPRRRDKRRHVKSSLDSKDPKEIIALAVRFDESSGQQAILNEPLENGRLYSQDDFWRALQYLEEETAPPKTHHHHHHHHSSNHNNHNPNMTTTSSTATNTTTTVKKKTLKKALTPIILSGLLANQRLHHHNSNSDNSVLSASQSFQQQANESDLVIYTQAKRKQASQRLLRAKVSRRVRLVGMVCTILFAVAGILLKTLVNLKLTIVALGYTGHDYHSTTTTTASSSSLLSPVSVCADTDMDCRRADADMWGFFRDYPLSLEPHVCNTHACPREKRATHILRPISRIPGRSVDISYRQPPYVMHTLLTQGLLRRKKKKHFVLQQDNIQWLGDSCLYSLLRPLLGEDARILDVGCGMGGLLYALWPSVREYYGIAIGPAEIVAAHKVATDHGLMDSETVSITFQQTSLSSFVSQRNNNHNSHNNNKASLRKWDAVLAIETLSYTSNVEESVGQLASLVASRGRVIVVDDVIADDDNDNEENALAARRRRRRRYPSLRNHSEWMSMLQSHNLVVEQARDLGLEYSMPQLLLDENTSFGLSHYYYYYYAWYYCWYWWNYRSLHKTNPQQQQQEEDERQQQQQAFSPSLRILEAFLSWAEWFWRDQPPESAYKRMVHLFQDSLRVNQAKEQRAAAHANGDLLYVLYVCTKK